MNRLKKINISLVLIIAILAASLGLAGCKGKVYLTTGLNKNELIKVSGQVVPMSLGKLILAVEKNSYSEGMKDDIWKTTVDGETLEKRLKDTVINQLSELKTISMLAVEKNIALTTSEKEKIQTAGKEFYESLKKEEIDSLGITKEDINTLYEYFTLSERLYELTTSSIDVEISDEEARVIKVQYCYVRNYYCDENNVEHKLDKDGLKAARAKIDEAYNKITNGGDFSLISKEYSDDTIYEYEFGRGEMDENFEKQAFLLENGQVSGVVEGEKGFYIIKCISNYEELKTEENKRELLKKYKNKAFTDMYEPYIQKQTFEYNKSYDDIDINSIVFNNSKLYEIYAKYFEEQ